MVGVWRPRWLRWLDSNQRVRESKSRALPLGDTPIWSTRRDSNPQPADYKSAALPVKATSAGWTRPGTADLVRKEVNKKGV